MNFDEAFLSQMEPKMQKAFSAMDELEKGAIANPDEKRMVGHYWLRAANLAPTKEIAKEVTDTLADIKQFSADVHSGKIKTPGAAKFTRILSIGIGGSALGPEFVADALGDPSTDKMHVHFIDNTDPDGIARTLRILKGKLGETLTLVTSKSGGTPETRNGMLVVSDAYKKAGLDFGPHAVAITMPGSNMDKYAIEHKWLKRIPMQDWVGGRTSELSSVGLVPAALQGIDIQGMLDGAAAMDVVTRKHDTLKNPSAMMALCWYKATNGKGEKDMVVLPYKDRLLLFSRYLQQLLMESLGKRLDLDGERVDQGISVYGNKGSTDQHAYVQQLRDGVNNFFICFVRVLESGGEKIEVEPGATPGDFLNGFLMGTREALFANDRQSMTITVQRVEAKTIGSLIALFERAVGFYGSLVNINAYHQPGVEAGKKAAAAVLALQGKIVGALSGSPQTADQVAAKIGAADSAENIYLLLEHLAANGRAKATNAGDPAKAAFAAV
jgi:glucose-6-phosphate isomerase